jgi:segregation and condensation protein B
VAYRQPVLRADIEAIRGVQCGEVLRQLMERGLVRIVGRSEELGRPFLYGTTRAFLQVFGLRDVDELPRLERYRTCASEAGDSQSAGRQQPEPQSEIVLNRPICLSGPGGDSTVKTVTENKQVWEEMLAPHAATMIEKDVGLVAGPNDPDEEDEDFDDEDDEEDEDYEDEDLEDADWEEVEDDEDLDEDVEEEEEGEEDLDEEEEDWDEDDWDEEEDEDWEEEEDDDWE